MDGHLVIDGSVGRLRMVERPEPAFSKLEKLARARRRTVAHLVEEVITGLVDALAPSEEEALSISFFTLVHYS
jgi:hypothetical protein